ncbi:MAG: BlaI/MecI/CopY family transcriptional regulator [Acidimicrobiales bacterium]|nr:BlaI/MecI/CopY family transcriptional regulator [Hyphomonadaceae bacterium]RZV40792.1 MAG: BlaI/MecI/CopY family transcriptional regulator [Acidimicrobiales bacterium]
MTVLPNPPELILLKALWRLGDIPVKQLHLECVAALDWSFSSTRKTLSRMVDKGMVDMIETNGPAKACARLSKTMALTLLSRDFMRRVLETDGPIPEAIFAGSRLLNDDELDELLGLL